MKIESKQGKDERWRWSIVDGKGRTRAAYALRGAQKGFPYRSSATRDALDVVIGAAIELGYRHVDPRTDAQWSVAKIMIGIIIGLVAGSVIFGE